MATVEKVSIDTMSNGAAIERLDLELTRVLLNIMDENTNPKAVREVNLKIKIKPTEDREAGDVTIQATSKLAPVVEQATQVYFGQDAGGNPEVSEIVKEDLFGNADNVSPLIKEGSNDA